MGEANVQHTDRHRPSVRACSENPVVMHGGSGRNGRRSLPNLGTTVTDSEFQRTGASAETKGKKHLIELLKLAVSAGLIAGLAVWMDWAAVSRAVATADATYLLLAVLAMAPTVVLAAWRWSYAARASDIHLSLPFYAKATYSALFVGQFLPAGLGVDAARLGFFMHRRARLASALQSLALDRLVGVVSVVCVLAIGLPFIWSRLSDVLQLFASGLVLATAVGLCIFLSLHRLGFLASYDGSGKRRKLIDLLLAVRRSVASTEALAAFGISIGIYCLMILGVHLIADAIGVSTDYPSLLAIVALAMFVSLLPFSVNGWGVREGAMVAGLAALSVPKESALAISLLFGVANAIITLPGVFVWHFRRKHMAAVD